MRDTYFEQATRSIADVSPNMFEGGYVLVRINVHYMFRGKGHGSALLARVLADADSEGATIWLDINPYGPLDYEALEAWYSRYGFVLQANGRYRREGRKVSSEHESQLLALTLDSKKGFSMNTLPAPDSFPGHEQARLTTTDNGTVAIVWVPAFPDSPELVHWNYRYFKNTGRDSSAMMQYTQIDSPYVPYTQIDSPYVPATISIEKPV